MCPKRMDRIKKDLGDSMTNDAITTLASQSKMETRSISMKGVKAFFKAIGDAFTDPNGYICLTKVGGAISFVVGVVGYFLGKDPTFMITAGLAAFATGKGLDATVKPEAGA